jgi:hypothetical protein
VEEADRANAKATVKAVAAKTDVLTYPDAGWHGISGTVWILGLMVVIALVVFVKFKIYQEKQALGRGYISQLESQYPLIRVKAAEGLRRVGDPQTMAALIPALKDTDPRVRLSAAGALSNTNDPRAVGALLEALIDRDEEVIAGAYTFFLKEGKPGSEDELIEALNQSGSEEMATAFLNCGNAKLNEAAREWASRKGYTVVPSQGESVHWGGAQ